MTRKLLFLLLPLLLLFFVSNVNAQTTTTGSIPSATTPAAIDAATKLKLQMQLIQDQRREAASKAGAVVQAKVDDFKAKLQLIKDQKKKVIVERIDTRLTEVNKNITTRFLDALTRLQTFLDKIKQTITSTSSATVMTDITNAQTAIDTARIAVDAQVAKTYSINITDDFTLRLNVGTTVSQFRQDLVAVYKLVINAKQTVQKLNTDNELIKEATSSAKQ